MKYKPSPGHLAQLAEARAMRTKEQMSAGAPFLRARHVSLGHMVKDPTPDELMLIATARAKGQ